MALLRFFNTLLRWSLWSIAGLLILAALYVSVGRQFIPLVAEYREQIEQELQQRLQQDIHIERLEGTWSGFSPVLEARDVSIGSGADLLLLDELHIQPDMLASLLARELRLKAVTLVGLQISVEEVQPRQWAVQGVRLDSSEKAVFKLNDWLAKLQQVAQLSVINSRVIVQAYGNEPLPLKYAGFTLSRVGAEQHLAVRAVLPDGQALELSAQGRLIGKDWQQSAINVYLKIPSSDLAQWLPKGYLADWQVTQLRTGGELWLQAQQGRIYTAAIEFADLVADVQAPQASAVHWQANLIQGFYQDDGQQQVAWLPSFTWQVDDLAPRNWPLLVRYSDQDTPTWKLAAEQLELADVHYLAERLLPLPEVAADVLQSMQPQGVLRHINLQWQPEQPREQRLAFAADVQQVGFSSWHDVPAATGISGKIAGGLTGGELRLASDDGFSLHLARLFPKPWQYLRAHSQLLWEFDPQGFTLRSPYLQVSGEEGEIGGDFLIRLLADPNEEDYMDLRVGLRDGDARFTGKYLPSLLPSFSDGLEHWLSTAIRAGRVNQGYFQYQGSLNKGAAPADRSISLYFDVKAAELEYQPGWPALTEAVGEVLIEDSGVRISIEQGKILNSSVTSAFAEIAHKDGQPPELELQAELQSSVADGLHILQKTPLAKVTDSFARWSGQGQLPATLDLLIPLHAGQSPEINLQLHAQDVELNIPDINVELRKLRGEFVFNSKQGLSAKTVSGRFLDQRFSGSIEAQGRSGNLRTHVDVTGLMPIVSLTRWADIKQTLPASGTLPDRLRLLLEGDDSQLRIDSSLLGVKIDLPAPFGKTSEQQSYADWRMTLAGKERRYWLDYADQLSLNLAAAADDLLAGRAELRVGGGLARLPTQAGLQVRGRLNELDIEQWQTVLQRYAGSATDHQSVLKKAQLQVKHLHGMGLSANDVGLLWQAGKGKAWSLNLDSQQLKGSLAVSDSAKPFVVHVEHLFLPKSVPGESARPRSDLLSNFDMRSIPAMNVKIDALYQGQEHLGSWSFYTRPKPRGISFEQLDLSLKGLKVAGQLDWQKVSGQVRSQYTGRISGANASEILLAWGYAPSITSDEFRIDASVHWPGSPAGLSLTNINGTADISFRKGQLVSVDGGAQALRVFGLLNFDSIGRRLRLDFSDLIDKGLAYDRIKGELLIDNGTYRTNKTLNLNGPSSDLELKGQIDLVKEQVNATLQVALPLTNNLPLAAIAVGAPAIGGALFIVDRLIGDRVARFASVKYYISGKWQNPTISLSKESRK